MMTRTWIFLLAALVAGVNGQEQVPVKAVSWRIDARLQLTGTLSNNATQTSVDYSFVMIQSLTMARDNGDYLVADASMPHCSGEYRLNGAEPRVWLGGPIAPLEPRIYYVSRDNGRCRVSLAIMERDWPGDLPRLTLPRSSQAQFLEGAKGYRRGLKSGSHRVEFSESELFESDSFVLPVMWVWSQSGRDGTDQHRLEGELRFERIEEQ
jgi:hypothetical protein